MNIAINLLNKTSKKCLNELKYRHKSVFNLVLFRNNHNIYLTNKLIFSYNKREFNKSLFDSLINRSMPSIICFVSSQEFDVLTYERIADQTLDHLNEELELILEQNSQLEDSDVNLSSGVITLKLGKHGIYVINKQTPNKQIWLSSPISGPKRYDWVNDEWVYKHDGISLFDLLNSELSSIFKRDIKIKSIHL